MIIEMGVGDVTGPGGYREKMIEGLRQLLDEAEAEILRVKDMQGVAGLWISLGDGPRIGVAYGTTPEKAHLLLMQSERDPP